MKQPLRSIFFKWAAALPDHRQGWKTESPLSAQVERHLLWGMLSATPWDEGSQAQCD